MHLHQRCYRRDTRDWTLPLFDLSQSNFFLGKNELEALMASTEMVSGSKLSLRFLLETSPSSVVDANAQYSGSFLQPAISARLAVCCGHIKYLLFSSN